MSVTVDQEMLATEELGLQTVGQVLSHLQRDNRLVVNLLIDGREPDLSQIQGIRKSLVQGRTLYIETVDPTDMAMEVLDDVQAQLVEAEEFKADAAGLLQQNQITGGMEKLGIYFSTWQSAQESVLKTCQLLKLDIETLRIGAESVAEILAEFTTLLVQTKQTLVDRDFVSLTDLLLYETTETMNRWTAVLDAIRARAGR